MLPAMGNWSQLAEIGVYGRKRPAPAFYWGHIRPAAGEKVPGAGLLYPSTYKAGNYCPGDGGVRSREPIWKRAVIGARTPAIGNKLQKQPRQLW